MLTTEKGMEDKKTSKYVDFKSWAESKDWFCCRESSVFAEWITPSGVVVCFTIYEGNIKDTNNSTYSCWVEG